MLGYSQLDVKLLSKAPSTLPYKKQHFSQIKALIWKLTERLVTLAPNLARNSRIHTRVDGPLLAHYLSVARVASNKNKKRKKKKAFKK